MQAYRHANTIFFAVYGTMIHPVLNPTNSTGWNYPIFPQQVSGVAMTLVTFAEYPGLVGFIPDAAPPAAASRPTPPYPYPHYSRHPVRAAIANSKAMTNAERIKLENAFINIQRGTFASPYCPASYEDHLLYVKALNMQVT